MYTKDITALLRLLWTSRQSGLLLVEPLEQQEIPWQGVFHLDKGAVKTCAVRNQADGRLLLSDDEAIRWLVNQGRLQWSLDEDAQLPRPTTPLLPAPEEIQSNRSLAEHPQPAFVSRDLLDSIPKRTQKGITLPVNAFASREQRQVFMLIDGRRNVEEIIHLLHKPPASVITILQELKAAGYIG